MDTDHLSIFSKNEQKIYLRIRSVRDRILHPVANWLVKHKIKADWVSYLSLAVAAPFAYFSVGIPPLALVFLILHAVLDSLDGAVARIHMQNMQAASAVKGKLLDWVCDFGFFAVFVLTLIGQYMITGIWGAFFLMNYCVLMGFILALNLMKVPLFYVLKPQFIFYLFFLIFTFTGWSAFQFLSVFFAVYLTITNVFLFHKIQCSLK